MAKKFKIGDVVQLNSGGPTMTVIAFVNGDVVCQWFIQNELTQTGSFVEECLHKVV